MLEPNVKRSTGGLRDIQLVRWLGRLAYGAESLDDLAHAGVISRADADAPPDTDSESDSDAESRTDAESDSRTDADAESDSDAAAAHRATGLAHLHSR